MPDRDNTTYSPDLHLPPLLKTSDEVWSIRFTGEVFLDYRLYVEKLQQYMQRVWTNKNSKVSGLTFEEALIGEQSHASVQCVGQGNCAPKRINESVVLEASITNEVAMVPVPGPQMITRPQTLPPVQLQLQLQSQPRFESHLPTQSNPQPQVQLESHTQSVPEVVPEPLSDGQQQGTLSSVQPTPLPSTPSSIPHTEEEDPDLEENVKTVVSKVLKAVGAHGATMGYLLQRLHDLHVKTPWSDSLSAHHDFLTVMTSDEAFVEVSRQRFALKELVVSQCEGQEPTPSGDASMCHSDGSSTSTDNQSTWSDDGTLAFERNNEFCSKCHKLYSEDYSPLLLCDTCPRVVHLMCAELDWKQLPGPSSPFNCPRCQAKGSAQDSEHNLEMTEEEWEAFGTLDKEERIKLRAKLCSGRDSQNQQEGPEQGSLDPFDDLDVMHEQHNFVWRMEQIKESMPPESLLAKQINDRIVKAQLEAEGPQGLAPMVTGRGALQSLMDALSVVEFLSTFRTECEARVVSLEMLYKAVVWPTENDILQELYISLLRCVLLDQVTQSGSTRSRARRWARVVDSATWPEILKRYLLSSRKSAGLYAINAHSVAIEDMDDQCVGLRAARDLMVMPYYKLKPEMHLRLLHALCNDIVNCQGMKNAMTVRIEEVSRLNVEKFHADAEDRKKDRVRKQTLKKGKRKHCGSLRTEAKRLRADCADDGDADGHGYGVLENGGDYSEFNVNGGIQGGECKDTLEVRRQRNAGFRAEIDSRSVRTEPAGLDRHHRRYWLFRGFRSCVCVEEPDGFALGCITDREALDDLMCRLNEDGSREQTLSKSLRAAYDDLVETLEEPKIPLDLTKVHDVLKSSIDGTDKPPEVAEKEAMYEVVRVGVSHLERLVTGLTNAGVKMDFGIKDWRRQFRSVSTVPGLSALLFNLETTLCHLADGLPKGADDATLHAILNQEPAVYDGNLTSALQEFDDSDVEDQPGPEPGSGTRKKRSSLWRTAHERLVWLRLMNDVRRTSLGSLGAYLSALLDDRAQPLVEDIARKQQAAEKAAEEEVLAAPVPRARKSARLSGTPNNNMRGQRTRGRPARAEVAQGRKVPRKRQKDGVRDSAKEMETGGAEDTTDDKVPKRSRITSVPTRLTARGVCNELGETNGGTVVERAPDDRWDYTCSVCKHGGEMLCCEAPECTVAMHMECIGLSAMPFGSWYCPNCSEQQPACYDTNMQYRIE